MTTTAMDIIQDSLEMLGVYAPGETVTAADARRGLITLNDMLDSWSNESLSCFAELGQSGLIQPGQISYTIGPGGDFDMVRPLRLIGADGGAYILDQNNNKYLIDVVPQDIWNSRTQANINSDYPDTLFYDPQYPLGIINLFPTPNQSWTMYWYSYLQLSDFSSLQAAMSLPPGYKLALSTNLAISLKPYFGGAQIDPLIIANASKSKGNIKRTNLRENIAAYDPAVVARANGSYNVYTDGYSR